MSKDELNSMSTLLNKVATGVTIHSDPRKKTFDRFSKRNDRRLTVMLTETVSVNVAGEYVGQAKKRKMPGN